MPDIAFDLRYLRYAILVAQHGSFRAAAESLDLSQSVDRRGIRTPLLG
ncbi:LysR family transcriptional regulator [Paracoccus denitrificans]